MATVDFTVTRYGRNRGSGAGTVRSSYVRLSGQDIITTVENVESTAGNDITLSAGEVFAVHVSAPMRISFGGVAATATTGHFIPADTVIEIEVDEPGTVSAIEA